MGHPVATEEEPRLSVIVPCFNEERRLPTSLARIREYLDQQPYSSEVLVVDDGSADGTGAFVERAASEDARVRLLEYGCNRGKGFAVQFGAAFARGDWVLFTDADLSTPIETLGSFLPYLESGNDLVIASRALPESVLQVRQPWFRERLGRGVNLCVRLVSGLPFSDTQCGFKLLSRRAARDLFPNLTVKGWMFDVELLILARKMGYRVIDRPVVWINSDESRVRWFHTLSVFRELFHIRWHWLRNTPKVVVPPSPSCSSSSTCSP